MNPEQDVYRSLFRVESTRRGSAERIGTETVVSNIKVNTTLLAELAALLRPRQTTDAAPGNTDADL